MVKRFLYIFIITSLLGSPFVFASASAGFNPNMLINDSRFMDTETLGGVSGIQKFLENKNSVLANTNEEFLLRLREPDQAVKEKLPDPRPNLGRLRTAAEFIYDASTSAGMNPQVVLVTLQKEQSLISGQFSSPERLQRALDRSLGFGCPDGGFCGEIYLGFYHQLFGNFDNDGNRYIGMPVSLIRSFYFEAGGARVGRGPMVDSSNNAFGSSSKVRVSRVGDTIVMDNTQGPPNNASAIQSVILTNFATAALYRYTPHVYNGNYNFWRFFNEWFKYPDGTLITSGDSQIYVLDSGMRRLVSEFVISQLGLDPSSIVFVSAGELASFPLGDVMLPKDGSVLRSGTGVFYLVEDQKLKKLSSFVAAQRQLNLNLAVMAPEQEIASYPDGGLALPQEGTYVKSTDNPAVYLIVNQQKRLLTAFVFAQRGFKADQILTAESGELDAYPAGSVMPPIDGTLIKSQTHPTVYFVSNGILRPMVLFVFNQRKLSFTQVRAVSQTELDNWQIGTVMPPETGVLVKSRENPTVYYMEAGVRRPVSLGVFINRGYDFKDVLLAGADELELFERGDELPLPDRALVKLKDDPTVYYLVDGYMHPLTYTAFMNRRLLFERVVEVSLDELAKYPVGNVIEN